MISYFSFPNRLKDALRAHFIAASLASAPELQKKTRSAKVASVSAFASSIAGSFASVFERCETLLACSVSALISSGWQ